MSDTANYTTSLETALEAQQDLLENSLEAAFNAYDEAKQRDVDVPVVFVIDCEDEIGGQIVRGWLGDAAVDDAIAEQRLARGEETENEPSSGTTVFAHAFSQEECRVEVPRVFPYLKPAFWNARFDTGFLAISVACGGASALTVPLNSRPTD